MSVLEQATQRASEKAFKGLESTASARNASRASNQTGGASRTKGTVPEGIPSSTQTNRSKRNKKN